MLTIFTLAALLMLAIHNYRLRKRLNHIEFTVQTVASTELIEVMQFTNELLIATELVQLPCKEKNTELNRRKAIQKVFEELAPISYQRYKNSKFS